MHACIHSCMDRLSCFNIIYKAINKFGFNFWKSAVTACHSLSFINKNLQHSFQLPTLSLIEHKTVSLYMAKRLTFNVVHFCLSYLPTHFEKFRVSLWRVIIAIRALVYKQKSDFLSCIIIIIITVQLYFVAHSNPFCMIQQYGFHPNTIICRLTMFQLFTKNFHPLIPKAACRRILSQILMVCR